MHAVWEPPRWVRATFATGTALLALAIVTIATNPVARGYEFSIFQAYPLWFWGALVGAIVCGQGIVLGNVFHGERDYWQLGVGLIGAVTLVLLAHPHVRYALYGRGDVLTHIGNVRHVVETGSFMETNYYPVIHVLAAVVAELTPLGPGDALGLLPVLFSLLYVAGSVYVAAYLSPTRSVFLLTLPIAALPLLGTAHTFAAPSAVSFFLVPLFVYLYLRLHDAEHFRTYAALFVLLMVALVPFHPLTLVYSLVALLALRVANAVADRVDGLALDVSGPIRTPTLLLGVVLFLWWYSASPSAVRSVFAILGPLFGDAGGGRLAHVLDVTSTYAPAFHDIVAVGIASYGLLGLLAGLAAVLAGLHVVDRRERDLPVGAGIAAFGGLLAGFTVLSGLAFVFDFLISYHRFARLVYFASPLLIGAGLVVLYDRTSPRHRRALTVVVVAGLAVLAAFTVLDLHLSPVTRDTNKQVTEMELSGADWFYENRDRSLLADELGFKQFRFYGATGDAYTRAGSIDDVVYARQHNLRLDGTAPPDRLGYADNATLGASYDADRYLIVTEAGRHRYPEVYPGYEEAWRYRPEDFDRLERDATVDHLYDNGEFDLYRVLAGGGAGEAGGTDRLDGPGTGNGTRSASVPVP